MTTQEHQKLHACLNVDPTETVTEQTLKSRLQRPPNGLTPDRSKEVIDEAHGDNTIRWVAYQGWVWAG